MDRLRPSVQEYDWGDREFLAALQGRSPSGRPEAELWMGAHTVAPSVLETTGASLAEQIAADPPAALGADVAAGFGELPFLMKILAAARPLSVQAHPSADQAVAGYAREDAAGIALDDPTRIYRDRNHKPELICALTPFEAKCGFRTPQASDELLAGFDDVALAPLRSRLQQPGEPAAVLANTLEWLLMGDADASDMIAAAAAGAVRITDGPYADAAAWTPRLAQLYPNDVGVLVALLLNHVTLEPGEALFLGAGNLHSYLQGAGVEVMASSDNVIRCGLTSKHVDVAELLAVVDCTPGQPAIQSPARPVHTYAAPGAEFALTRVEVQETFGAAVTGPEIVVITEGEVELTAGAGGADQTVTLTPGAPVWIPATDRGWSVSGRGTLFRSAVPADIAAVAPSPLNQPVEA